MSKALVLYSVCNQIVEIESSQNLLQTGSIFLSIRGTVKELWRVEVKDVVCTEDTCELAQNSFRQELLV